MTLVELETLYNISLYDFGISLGVVTTYMIIALVCYLVVATCYASQNISLNGSNCVNYISTTESTFQSTVNSLQNQLDTAITKNLILPTYILACEFLDNLNEKLFRERISNECILAEASTLGDIYNLPSIRKRINDANCQTTDIDNLIVAMIEGISSIQDLDDIDKKVFCIGRDILGAIVHENDNSLRTQLETMFLISPVIQYNIYAAENDYYCFYSPDYPSLTETDNQKELMKIANISIIEYLTTCEWVFILVTEPYYYIQTDFDYRLHGGDAYNMELFTLINKGYGYFNNNNSWNSIRNRNYTLPIYYYTLSADRVGKSALNERKEKSFRVWEK